MVEMPCYPIVSDIDRAHDYCSAKVDEKIQHELQVAVGGDQAQTNG